MFGDIISDEAAAITGSLGMLQSTANTYEKYVPVTIMRNLYYQIGSMKSKGALRFGKVTIDGGGVYEPVHD